MTDVRCDSCGKLLFRIKQEKDVYIECKCPKCKKINKIQLIKTGD
jgi:phage FluMu protein Com